MGVGQPVYCIGEGESHRHLRCSMTLGLVVSRLDYMVRIVCLVVAVARCPVQVYRYMKPGYT